MTNHICMVLVLLRPWCFQEGQAHLTMISRQTSELGKPIFNPGQHPLPILTAGNEGALAGAHIPAHHCLLNLTGYYYYLYYYKRMLVGIRS